MYDVCVFNETIIILKNIILYNIIVGLSFMN